MKSVYTFFLFFFLIINSSVFGQNCFQKLYKNYSIYGSITGFYDNTFIVSGNMNNMANIVCKLDSNHNLISTKYTNDFSIYRIVKHPNGSYYGIGKNVASLSSFSFVFKIDKDLTINVLRAYSIEYGELSDIKILNDNRIVICAQSGITGEGWKVNLIDTLGNSLWSKVVGEINSRNSAPYLSVNTNQEIILSGTSRFGYYSDENIGIVKLDVLGNIIWGYDIGTEQQEAMSRNIVSSDGHIYVISRGISDISLSYPSATFVIKLDTDGNQVWAKEYLFSDDISTANFREDADSNLVLFSNIYFRNHPNTINKPLTFCIDRNGNPKWAYSYGVALPDDDLTRINDGYIDSVGNVITTGAKWYGPNTNEDYGALLIKANKVGRTYCDDTIESFITRDINFSWTPINSSRISSFTEVSEYVTGFFYPNSPIQELCSGDTTNYFLKIKNNNKSNFEINVFPNPISQTINIDCKNCISKDLLEIYDGLGQLVYKNNYSSTIDIGELKAGIYSLRYLSDKNGIHNLKIIKP